MASPHTHCLCHPQEGLWIVKVDLGWLRTPQCQTHDHPPPQIVPLTVTPHCSPGDGGLRPKDEPERPSQKQLVGGGHNCPGAVIPLKGAAGLARAAHIISSQTREPPDSSLGPSCP